MRARLCVYNMCLSEYVFVRICVSVLVYALCVCVCVRARARVCVYACVYLFVSINCELLTGAYLMFFSTFIKAKPYSDI